MDAVSILIATVGAAGGAFAAWLSARPAVRSSGATREAEFRDDLIVLLERAQGDADRLRTELEACRTAHLATRLRLDRLLAIYGEASDD